MSTEDRRLHVIKSTYRDNERRANWRPGEPVELEVSRQYDWISIAVRDSDHLTDIRLHKSEMAAIIPALQELLSDSEE